mmetsp:Transcript_107741/g.304789  ORF Transcript_107741/g.304789 Transcript_107741/m.304789 type:complete len:460 (+) Transcript_107741:45-1424(+)
MNDHSLTLQCHPRATQNGWPLRGPAAVLLCEFQAVPSGVEETPNGSCWLAPAWSPGTKPGHGKPRWMRPGKASAAAACAYGTCGARRRGPRRRRPPRLGYLQRDGLPPGGRQAMHAVRTAPQLWLLSAWPEASAGGRTAEGAGARPGPATPGARCARPGSGSSRPELPQRLCGREERHPLARLAAKLLLQLGIELAPAGGAGLPEAQELLLAGEHDVLDCVRAAGREVLEHALARGRVPQHPQRGGQRTGRERAVRVAVLQRRLEKHHLQQEERELHRLLRLGPRQPEAELAEESQRRRYPHNEAEPREQLKLRLQDRGHAQAVVAEVREDALPVALRELALARQLHLRADRREQDPLDRGDLDGRCATHIVAVKRQHNAVKDGIIKVQDVEGLHHPVDQLTAVPEGDGPRDVVGTRLDLLRECVLSLHDRVDDICKAGINCLLRLLRMAVSFKAACYA